MLSSTTTAERAVNLSADEVRLALAGKLVELRRAVKLPANVNAKELAKWAWDGRPGKYGGYGTKTGFVPLNVCGGIATHAFHRHHVECPFGSRGDVLWVREKWAVDRCYDHLPPRKIGTHNPCFYGRGYNGTHNVIVPNWHKPRSPIGMPRWASRLTFTVTSVRVEQSPAGIWEWVVGVRVVNK